MSNNSEGYVPDLVTMQNLWPSKSVVSHFTWEDVTPPMSHIGTPTEDYCPPHSSPVQSFLQMPMNSTTNNTATTPPVQTMAPAANAMQQSMMSTSPQQSLAIKQFKFSTVSDTPTPSPSSDDDNYSATSPMSDKQGASECSEDFTLCKSKQEVLKLIPKDVRVPQSKQ